MAVSNSFLSPLEKKPIAAYLGLFSVIFFFIVKWYIFVLDEAILMRTHNIPSYYRKSKRYLYFAFCSGATINTHLLELPLSRRYFLSPKDVRAIEVLLYFRKMNAPAVLPIGVCGIMT